MYRVNQGSTGQYNEIYNKIDLMIAKTRGDYCCTHLLLLQTKSAANTNKNLLTLVEF